MIIYSKYLHPLLLYTADAPQCEVCGRKRNFVKEIWANDVYYRQTPPDLVVCAECFASPGFDAEKMIKAKKEGK